jgi:hypothetical protein
MTLQYMQKAAVAIPDERSISYTQDIMKTILSSYGVYQIALAFL